ncbi:hypothetical protein [Pyxidicoccus caerfyrddinensis]|uniref:hypothetical protein n=1 Tax=Pyxidicoccus caerfyrddinensis TaxID=2709663 RepID=UPI0013DBC611|nr:hypothetical protein [Pyxidicoccus caerfyrddinensis]
MFRRVVVSAFVVSAMGLLGCGGGAVPDSSGDDAALQQDPSALETPCSQLQNRGCGPFSELSCQFPDGQPGWCMCQDFPHNQWQCFYLD